MKRFSRLFILCFGLALLATGGCKKLSTDTSILVLNVYPYFGNDSIVPGKIYRTAVGDSISFSRADFYISNIQLNGTSGTSISDSGYTLVTFSNHQNLIVGSVPTGNYNSISFNVGVTSSLNHIDPATYAAGPLAAQSPSMHFADNNTGYIFMAFEGAVDSTNNNASPNKLFSYHIGTDSLLHTVNLPDHSAAPYNSVFTATGTKVLTINIIADFSQLLQNVNTSTSTLTNTTDNTVLADTLAAHIPVMFRYQQ